MVSNLREGGQAQRMSCDYLEELGCYCNHLGQRLKVCSLRPFFKGWIKPTQRTEDNLLKT